MAYDADCRALQAVGWIAPSAVDCGYRPRLGQRDGEIRDRAKL
jgi:hypothetical protein